MEKKSGAREALLHLSASAPLLALGLALKPFLPAFQQSIAEQAKSGRESFWASYDSQARDAAQLMQKAGLAWRWLRRRVQLLKATDWQSCRQMLVDSFHQLAAGLSSLRPGANQALKSTLDDVTRECDDAKALFQAGKLQEAESCYEKLLSNLKSQPALRGEHLRVLTNLAVCQKKRGRYQEALQSATAALQMDPKCVKALFTRAGCFRAEGRLAEAVDDFATACRYDATLADAKKEWLQAHKELAKATGDHQHFSRVEVLALVAEMNRAHTAVQEAISQLGQRLLLAMRERQMEQHLPFLAAHELVRQHGLPADPILDFDLTAEAFQELLGHFEDDDEVMESAQSMLHPPGRGDPARARQITIPQILEAHKVMVQELETLLSQFKNLSAQELGRVDCKLIEATAELQTYLGVSRLQLQPEDVEEAILTNEMELQNDADFVKCSEDLASLMQELLTAAAELNHER